MKKPSNITIGACGEHYVAAYLSGFNLIVAVPRAGVPGFDLLVSNDKGGHAIRLQVKTGTKSIGKYEKRKIYLWRTSYAAIERNDEFLWYAYVYLKNWPKEKELPEVFFVQNKDVVACVKECKEYNDSWPCFWMYQDDAEKYKGKSGLQSLLDSLGT